MNACCFVVSAVVHGPLPGWVFHWEGSTLVGDRPAVSARINAHAYGGEGE